MAEQKYWQLVVCEGPTCGGCHDSSSLTDTLTQMISAQGLQDRARVFTSLCLGRCGEGPNLVVRELEATERLHIEPTMFELEEGVTLYTQLHADRLGEILSAHLGEGQPVAGWGEPY